MAILRSKEIRSMKEEEKLKRINELKLELIKEKGKVSQGGSNKVKEIKRTIARLKTIR